LTERRQSLLLFAALWFAPSAWVLELVAGYWFEEATCSRGSMAWGVNDKLWQGVTLAVCASLAAAGLAAAWLTWRALREGAGDARGRTHFLAVWSLSASAVFVVATVMTGIGVLSLDPCKG
jgi:hypothetical protein